MFKPVLTASLSLWLLFAANCPLSAADSVRVTPLVKALRQAKLTVVNIHSRKTTYSGDTVFGQSTPRKVNGMGTGIIIDERGYIVTNHHVVDGVDSLRVTLFDGSSFTAHVVAYDRPHDLGLIKINASKPLPVMPPGTSSDLMLGETVIAVGNAFGYEHTVTSGIVSALSRDVEVNEKQSYKNLIQTDASINPGNSGGPLLNLKGEVIGINVAIRANAQRIGFAIPIDDAREIIAQLMSTETLSQTYHGLITKDVNAPQDQRLVVEGTQAQSPAEKAGLQTGDVVVKVGDITVHDRVDLERALLGVPEGEAVPVIVRRKDHQEQVSLKLAGRNHYVQQTQTPATVVRANNDEQPSVLQRAWDTLGMRLQPLADGEKEAIPSRYRGGMRVLAVREESPAEQNGIREGDVLIGLHEWETVDTSHIAYVLDHPQLNSFMPLKFYILRGNETLYGYLRLVLASK